MSYNCFTEINRICHRNRIMLISLFKLTSIYNSSILLCEMPFSNNQMVNTRSGGGQDVPPFVRAHIANQQNPVPPPPLNPAMDPATQQFFATDAADPEPHRRSAEHTSPAKSATTTTTCPERQAQGVHEPPPTYLLPLNRSSGC
jgi:hypothetical protein